MGRRIYNFKTLHVGFLYVYKELCLYNQSPTLSSLVFSYCMPKDENFQRFPAYLRMINIFVDTFQKLISYSNPVWYGC